MSLKLKTPDIDFAAAMLSRGAKLEEGLPWTKEGPRFSFCLDNVSEPVMQEYRIGAAAFSITAFTTCRRFLLEIIKTEGR